MKGHEHKTIRIAGMIFDISRQNKPTARIRKLNIRRITNDQRQKKSRTV